MTKSETGRGLAATADRRRLLLLSAGFVLVAFLSRAYFSRNEAFSVDDSFITFNYAWNFLHGYGPVFNVGERYFGTTALGYSLILAAVYWASSLFVPTLTIQNVSVLLSAVSISGTCLMLLWASRDALRRNLILFPLFVCFVLYMFCAGPFNEVAGHETYAFLAVSLAATLLAGLRHGFSAGLILALAATLRPDAVLFAPIIGAGLLLRESNVRAPWRNVQFLRFSLGFLLLMVPWFGWTTYYYGRPIPGTLEAKRAQVLMGYWPHYDARTVFSYLQSHGDALLLAAFLIVVGCLAWDMAVSNGRVARFNRSPLLFVVFCWALFCFLSVAFYSAVNVTFWVWYGVPVVFSLVVCAYGSAVVLCESDNPTRVGTIALRIATATVVVLTLGNVEKTTAWFKTENVNKHLSAYFELADFLKSAEPRGAVVETAEPGSLAFRLGPKFKVVDELGLITPGVAEAHLNGDSTYANRTYRPDYVVCSWRGKYSACSYDNIMANYRLVGEFDNGYWEPRLGRGALLYKRIPD